MDWFLAAQIVLMVLALWLFTVYMCSTFPTLSGKKILLLIAHPDDEAMFFAPTLRWLTKKELGNVVIILCFSSGNADGLGHIRKDELKKSAMQLGITSLEHVVVIEDEKFPDSMTTTWDSKAIGAILQRYFAPDISKTATTSPPRSYIDAIVTFDAGGVSGHPNHISLYQGSVHFLKTLMQRHRGWECPTKLYTLTTTNILRKYTSIIDSMVTIFTVLWRPKDRKSGFPSPLLIVSGPLDVWRAQKAMTSAHKSQMRWFRWGWVGISRYMVVNDLDRQKVV